MSENDMDEVGHEGHPSRIQSFIEKQRQIMGGYIEDQLGPATLLDQLISGKPPLTEEITGPNDKSSENQG
jgi:hypothetical protein